MKTLLLVLGFAVLILLVYKLWKPLLRPAKQPVQAHTATLYFFYTPWCGFSKKALPEWEKVDRHVRSTSYGNTKVTPVKVDCESDTEKCALYNIQAYPTVLLETPEGIHELDQFPSFSNVDAFLRETLG